jgi:lysozyme
MRFLYVLGLLIAPIWATETPGARQVAAVALQGIDVSHYQKYIEWDTVVSNHWLDFAFVKATEGHDYRDSLFCRNWSELRRLGVRRGAYHFFRAYGCGYDQALNFLHCVEMEPGDLAPVLDIETVDGMPTEVLLQEARIWLETVEQRLGIKPIVYSNQKFYERYLAGQLDDYPLWVARYSTDHPELHSRLWDFWQYSNTGTVEGIEHEVDLNIFTGTPGMLDKLCWFPEIDLEEGTDPLVAP